MNCPLARNSEGAYSYFAGSALGAVAIDEFEWFLEDTNRKVAGTAQHNHGKRRIRSVPACPLS